MHPLYWTAVRAELAVRHTLAALNERRDERGDVPGWVFITVMSVGLVGAIGSVATTELRGILSAALGQVR